MNLEICICSKCKEEFILGVNGITYDNKDTCDRCLGICRDANGYAWLPDEVEQIYRPIYAKDSTYDFKVTRQEAFGIKEC